MADQNRLLVIELKPVQAGDGMHENAERGAFQMEKLAAVFADKVHFGFAATGTCVTVLQFLVLFDAHNLHDA